MKSATKEQGSNVLWLILSIIFCFGAIRLSLGNLHEPGSGFFPFLAGAALFLLSLINFLASLVRNRRAEGESESPREPISIRNIIVALFILFAFPLQLNVIGLAPTLFVFFALLLRVIEPQRWCIALGGSAAGAVIFSLIFQVWLRIQFPRGIFGI